MTRAPRFTGEADYTLLGYFGILLVFGLIMLTSASSVNRFDDPFFFITRQLMYGVVPGILLFFALAKLQYTHLKQLSIVLFGLSIILLIAVLIPGIGADYGTRAQSWLTVAGFSFQPAELAKLGLIVFYALYLAKRGKAIQDFKHGFLPALGIGLLPVVLVGLQPDTGSAAILFTIVFAMLLFAGARASHLGLLGLLAVLAFLVFISIAPYRAERLTTFLNPDENLESTGYHILQAEVAIGSGGWLGRGLGHSRQKHAYLPEVHADSIFAVMAEEMGFILSFAFIVLLVMIARRGFLLANHCSDDFGRLAVAGILIWFLSQSFVNIGSMMGLMPITGVPLPFVSHGGTALAIAIGAIGVLMNVSKHAET